MPILPLFRMSLFCSLGMFTLVLFFHVVIKYYLPSLLSFLVPPPLVLCPGGCLAHCFLSPPQGLVRSKDSQSPPRLQFPEGLLAGTLSPFYSEICISFCFTFWKQREVFEIFHLVPPSTNSQLTSELKGMFPQSQERGQRRMGAKSI